MINKHLAFLVLDEDSPYTNSCLSKNVTAKCTETLSPPPSIQFSLAHSTHLLQGRLSKQAKINQGPLTSRWRLIGRETV